MSLTPEQLTQLAALASQHNDSYRQFVMGLTSPAHTYNLSDEVITGLLNALERLTPSSLELDHFKRVMTYGDKLRINPPTRVETPAAAIQAARAHLADGDTELNTRLENRLLLVHGLLGKITEALELAVVLREALTRDDFDAVNLLEELGDDAFYTALVEEAAQIVPGDVVRRNVMKLGSRYKGGVFTQAEALNRDLAAERAALGEEVVHG